MSDFTVIIPVYIINELLLTMTKEAISGLGDVHLIIIDNNSPLGGGYLRSAADTYIRNKVNLGYAPAVNQGLKLSKTPYTAVGENDIRVSPNWQEAAREALQDPTVYSCHFRMTDYDVPFQYGKQVVLTGKERWCTAPFFVIGDHKKVLFDENFFNSYEDYDYFYRIRRLGYKTAYTDKASFQHHHSLTQRLVGFKGTKNNREYFKEKHGEYADDLIRKSYPKQWEIDYWRGFDVL